MRSFKPITIVGGGLAGLTLGISLRRHNVPVTILEAGHYPRHRVCGEFISGQGQETLGRLGLIETLIEVGARPAPTARFFRGVASTPLRAVDPPALCLSRYIMDKTLADVFRVEGGQLRENSRWDEFGLNEGLVRATGRRAKPTANGWRWFGLKVHVKGVQIEADLEMHSLENGYVGICQLPDGELNVCGLFRRRSGTDGKSPIELMRGAPGTALHDRLAQVMIEEESFCSVAGLALQPQRAVGQRDCQIGDALTMIPPVTGNGMSMAFESAELSLEPILAYARGELTWESARLAVARACDAAFRQRLLWARLLQAMMFSPVLRGRLGVWLLHSRWLWQTIFSNTR